jgi:hypothetical protein
VIPAEVVELIIELRQKLTATGLDARADTIGTGGQLSALVLTSGSPTAPGQQEPRSQLRQVAVAAALTKSSPAPVSM